MIERVTLIAHDFDNALPFDGPFDAIITSLALHHASDERKRPLHAEIAQLLAPGGVFCNLEIVASPTQALHDRWREEMERTRRPVGRVVRHGDPARVDQRDRTRERRLHLEVAKPRAVAWGATALSEGVGRADT